MDSFEINKVLGALLATLFVMFSIGIVSNSIFAVTIPETPGFTIAVPEPEEGGEATAEAPAGEAQTSGSIATLIAKADPAAGKAVFKKCLACHTEGKDGPNRVGPNLWNIVNRPVASHEGFSYSAAMKEFSQGSSVVWDFDHINQLVTSPKALVKGTAMTFPGLKKEEDRANLLAYLRTLSDNPAPLPRADAAPADEAAPAQ